MTIGRRRAKCTGGWEYQKVLEVIKALMEEWETRIEVQDNGKVRVSMWMKAKKGFLQGDTYSPVGFCLRGANRNVTGRENLVKNGKIRATEHRQNS